MKASRTGTFLAGRGVALVVALSMGLAQPASGAEKTKKDCPHAGEKLGAQQLKTILEKHVVWLDSGGIGNRNVPGRAVLCMANLSQVDLRNANLLSAGLEMADLNYADLRNAILFGAALQGAKLYSADLRDANLGLAKLEEANLITAKLQGANLDFADLRGAFLRAAKLQKAKLRNAILFGADLENAKLNHTNLERAAMYRAVLKGADLRNAILDDTVLEGANFAEAKLRGASLLGVDVENLSVFATLNGKSFPSGLLSVREKFKNAGEREAERYLTFLIKRNERSQASAIEEAFSYIMFEATSEWGYAPGRPLRLLGALILIFTLAYLYAIGRAPARSGAGGIYRIWPEGRLKETSEAGHQMELAEKAMVDRLHLTNVVLMFFYALFFSLLSAFHIGWRDLNVGSWLSRLQAREYTLRARGWVRVASGLQSLISVYLLALWALVYFGRPFE